MHKIKGFSVLILLVFIAFIAALACGLYIKKLRENKKSGESLNALSVSEDLCIKFSNSAPFRWIYILGAGDVDESSANARLAFGVYDADKNYTGMAFKNSGSVLADKSIPTEFSIRKGSEAYSLSSILGSQFLTFQGPRAEVIVPEEVHGPLDIYMQSEVPLRTDLRISVSGSDIQERTLVEKKSIFVPANDNASHFRLDMKNGILCEVL